MENSSRGVSAAELATIIEDVALGRLPVAELLKHAVSHKEHCPAWCSERHDVYPGEVAEDLNEDPCYGPGFDVTCAEYPNDPLLVLLLRHPGAETVIEVTPTNGFAHAEDGDRRTRTFALDQARALRDKLTELLLAAGEGS